MEKKSTKKGKAITTVKLTKNSKLYKTIIKSIQDKKGEDIVIIDLRNNIEAVADFFVICTATSSTQIKAIADFIIDEVEINCQEKPYKKEGYTGQQWILIDYVNIVVHVMHPNSRTFYKLEEMWSDGEISAVEN